MSNVYYLILMINHQNLFIGLAKTEKTMHVIKKPWNFNTSELLFENLKTIFIEQKISWSQVSKIYATIGPGSYLANRILVTFLKTLKILLPNIKLFTLNNLIFQINSDQPTISLLTASRRNYYWTKFYERKCVFGPEIISKSQWKRELSNYNKYLIVVDFDNCDFIKQFYFNQALFEPVVDWLKLKPIEINPFITKDQ